MLGDTRMSPGALGQAKQPAGIRMHGPGTGGCLVHARVCVGSGTSKRKGKGVRRHFPEPPHLLWEECSTFRRQKYRGHLHCHICPGIQCLLLLRALSSKELLPRLTWKDTSTSVAKKKSFCGPGMNPLQQ